MTDMNFESGRLNKSERSHILADKFKSLDKENLDLTTFTELEAVLEKAGFEAASKPEVVEILNDSRLFCRNENFTKLLNLVEGDTPIELSNPHNEANICAMSNIKGFKIAMTEGFAGRDVEF
jgi:hypothetical protein